MGRAAQLEAATVVGKLELAARGDARAGIIVRHGSLLEVYLCQCERRNSKYAWGAEGKIRSDLLRVKVWACVRAIR